MIEAKFNDYFKHFKELPEDVFNELIYKFKQSFPKSGRIDGINYFDDLLEMLIDKYSVNIKKQQKKISYVWENNPDKELPELYSLMINKYKLIASETTYEHFKAVFTGQPIESINPIKWRQENASELIYFNEAIKNKVNVVWSIYQRMKACFVKPDGKPFNVAWKSLKTDIEMNLSPDKQKVIDELISNF